jgi:hypothetical protein
MCRAMSVCSGLRADCVIVSSTASGLERRRLWRFSAQQRSAQKFFQLHHYEHSETEQPDTVPGFQI